MIKVFVMAEFFEEILFYDNGGRRNVINRRTRKFAFHIPEKRTGTDRRKGRDRRKAPRANSRLMENSCFIKEL